MRTEAAMAKTDFRSVEESILAQPKSVQPVLRRVRSVIRKAVPAAVEVISYQLPAYKLAQGPGVLCFAAWKQHYSLYPASDELMAAFKGELRPFRASKGTLRFSLSEPVPVKLIERIARFRAKEAMRRAKAKLALKKRAG
jgi:uncharacterized protein YdhG (YjbR/CyaY superfamily)